MGVFLSFSLGTAYAQISHSDKGYTFRLKAKLGETLNYMLSTHQEMSNTPEEFGMQATDMSMTIKDTCIGIKGDLLTMKTVCSPYRMNGHIFGKSTVSETKMKRDGDVVVNGFSGMPSMNLGKLYDHPLQVGKTYKLPVSIRSSNKSTVKVIEYETVKFVGFSHYKGHQTAKFQLNFNSTVTIKMKNVNRAVSKAKGTEIELISVADGWPEYIKIRSNSTSEMPALSNSSFHASNLTMITTMERE